MERAASEMAAGSVALVAHHPDIVRAAIRLLASHLSFASSWLGSLGQLTQPVCVSASSSVKWNNSFTLGFCED